MRLSAQCPDGAPPPCARGGRPPAVSVDTHVVAVLPFRVSGVDTSLSEGLAELLAVEFTGVGAPRAADMGSVLRAWRSAGGSVRLPLAQAGARQAATQVGAGMVLNGSVVGIGSRLSLSAQLVRSRDGGLVTQVGPVQGHADSLPELLQRLAAGFISAPVAGGLRGVDLEALRAYMTGRAAYHRSQWIEAGQAFDRALTVDSTFALAAFGYLQASGWFGLPGAVRATRLAWTYRDRLDPRDREQLVAYLGPRYPAPSSVAEVLAARLAIVQREPGNAESWFNYGDELFHRGELTTPDALAQARRAFEQALALDSGLVEAAVHLSTLADIVNDTALGLRYSAMTLRLAPTYPYAVNTRLEYLNWSGRARPVLDSIERAGPPYPAAITQLSVFGASLGQPGLFTPRIREQVLAAAVRQASTPEARRAALVSQAMWQLLRGRPAAAAALLADDDAGARATRLQMALFGDGQRGAADQDAAMLATQVSDSDTLSHCVLGAWYAGSGDAVAAERHAARLRDAPADASGGIAGWCGPYVDAAVAVARRRPDAPSLAARVDSIMAQGLPTRRAWNGLAMGRLWAALGDWPQAVRAVRRRGHIGGDRTGSGDYLAERLLAESRWAAQAGDTVGALRAARYYLVLRDDPEPSLMLQRDSVRAELARLERH